MIAKLNYRTHVPYGWLAIPYCHITFFEGKGETHWQAMDLDVQLGNIIHERYNQVKPDIDRIEANQKAMEDEIKKCDQIMKDSKVLGIFLNSEGKAARDRRIKLVCAVEQAKEKVKMLRDKTMPSTFEQVNMATKFLANNGFRMVSMVYKDCNTNEEVWERT